MNTITNIEIVLWIGCAISITDKIRYILKMYFCHIYDIKNAVFTAIISLTASAVISPIIFFFMAGAISSKNWGLLGASIYIIVFFFYWLHMLEGRCRYYEQQYFTVNKNQNKDENNVI